MLKREVENAQRYTGLGKWNELNHFHLTRTYAYFA
jgi:hypothetical protein